MTEISLLMKFMQILNLKKTYIAFFEDQIVFKNSKPKLCKFEEMKVILLMLNIFCLIILFVTSVIYLENNKIIKKCERYKYLVLHYNKKESDDT